MVFGSLLLGNICKFFSSTSTTITLHIALSLTHCVHASFLYSRSHLTFNMLLWVLMHAYTLFHWLPIEKKMANGLADGKNWNRMLLIGIRALGPHMARCLPDGSGPIRIASQSSEKPCRLPRAQNIDENQDALRYTKLICPLLNIHQDTVQSHFYITAQPVPILAKT